MYHSNDDDYLHDCCHHRNHNLICIVPCVNFRCTECSITESVMPVCLLLWLLIHWPAVSTVCLLLMWSSLSFWHHHHICSWPAMHDLYACRLLWPAQLSQLLPVTTPPRNAHLYSVATLPTGLWWRLPLQPQSVQRVHSQRLLLQQSLATTGTHWLHHQHTVTPVMVGHRSSCLVLLAHQQKHLMMILIIIGLA